MRSRMDKWLEEGADEYREKQKKQKIKSEFEITDKPA